MRFFELLRSSLKTTLVTILISSLGFLPATAEISDQASNIKFDCPIVSDGLPNEPTPSALGFVFNATNQVFSRVNEQNGGIAQREMPLVGCYVERTLYENTGSTWQIGVIGRDSNGYFWKNGAGVSWRLTLSSQRDELLTDQSNPYYKNGNKFILVLAPTFESSSSVKSCKIASAGRQKPVSIDFPISRKRISPVGSPKVLLVVTDFVDSPYSGKPADLINKIFEPAQTRDFFLGNSYGKLAFDFSIFPDTIRTEIKYSDARPVRSAAQYKVKYDVISKLPKSVWEEKFDSIVVLGYGVPEVFGAWAAGQEAPLSGVPYDFYNPGFAWSGIYNEADQKRLQSWKIFAHELGHLLGLIDLGATQVPDNFWKGGTPGPFDLMGQSPGVANEFFGWHRWLLGWINDDQVLCLDGKRDRVKFEVSSLSRPTQGFKIAVIPVSEFEVIVIESRRQGIYDTLGVNEGILVYRIDIRNTYHPTLQPLKIIARESDRLKRAFSPDFMDIDRYLEATLNPSQYVISDGFMIESLSSINGVDSIEVFLGNAAVNRVTFLEEQKAAAEQKAKQEVEAKAAAELKAKQEAEAKAALEKAAAELRAKQEAEAKAALAAKKKTTITCVKGKLTKKVTAVKPTCPKGYKKK
jgi:M6 family metalloprotease-like protein